MLRSSVELIIWIAEYKGKGVHRVRIEGQIGGPRKPRVKGPDSQ